MSKCRAVTARQLWPKLEDLESWTFRNCMACRFRSKPLLNTPPFDTCLVLVEALKCHLKDMPLSPDTAAVVLEHPDSETTTYMGTAPHTCRSRVDKRGLPKSL